ncbi:MAG: DUF4157 domain-containing protein, partial [Alphaproteobacteria bacterium]|nr:DUF4157 domain-containing protein [Alphaproteobacteria bacterium]
MTVAPPTSPRRMDRIPPPQPDLPDALALESDADARADRALSDRGLGTPGLETASPRTAGGSAKGAEAGFRGLGAGRALPPQLAGRLSRALGVDLSPLRLHTGAAAAARAEAMGARAATAGTDIVLGADAQDLSRPDAVQTVAHEAAHIAQRASRTELPSVLRQDKDTPGTGIGRAPPRADYSRGTGLAAEDRAVTFAFDSADLSPTAQADLRALAATWTGPVEIDLYGYASAEGPGVYNLNLSAHRAVAVRRLLQPLLPEGSVVRLHAHGEITDFDPAEGNRRVGIDVTEKAASTATPAQVPGLPAPAPPRPAAS